MRHLGLSSLTIILSIGGLSACGNSDTTAAVTTPLSTELKTTLTYDDFGDAAYWFNHSDSSKSLLIATLEDDGLAVFSSHGEQLQQLQGIAPTSADIRYDISDQHAGSADILAVALPEQQSFGFYAISDDPSGPLTDLGSFDVGFNAEGLCLYKNITTGELMVTGVADDGMAKQFKLSFDGSQVSSRLQDVNGVALPVREFSVGGKLSACIADDELANLYIAEQNIGIWAYGANPENVKERQLVDGVAPLGHLQEIEGLELIYQAQGKGYLVAADEGAGLLFYQRDNWVFNSQQRVAGIDETKALAVAEDGLWLANSELEQPIYEKLSFTALNQQNGLSARPISDVLAHRELSLSGVALVAATGETAAVDDDGDAADDPAFWLNPDDAEQSLIIATNKQGGLLAYNLQGQQVQYLAQGKPNNVDIRSKVQNFAGQDISIAAASNRELNTIALYQIRSADGQDPIVPLAALGNAVHPDAAELQSSLDEVYGLCMYQSADNTAYVFVNGKNGQVEQWRLTPVEGGFSGEVVRTLSVASQPEGCVVDDSSATLYLGEEDQAIWQFSAEEGADTQASLFAKVDGENLVADIEGLTLYDDGIHKYLLASSQGNNTYVAYDLAQNNRLVGHFAIIGDDNLGVDGASDTDGIHAVSANLGSAYPKGLFIAQDWYNIDANYQQLNQNFKLVDWQTIQASFDD
ncbi:phytase [Agarivorans sp. Z349TD_8]|uniref:phytase n=1 Tax=Agarivorans sp. Z349TD_8 TaxID=3421434 RepID=UPI003D7E9331